MYRHAYKTILSVILLCVLFPSGWGWAKSVELIGREILDEIWRFHPVGATNQGVHTYDTLLADYSENSLKRAVRRFSELKTQLDGLDTLSLSIDELIDYHLLHINLMQELVPLEVTKAYEKNPLIYVNECIDGIYTLVIRSTPSTSVRVYAIEKRLSQIQSFLENAAKNLKKPPWIFCKIGIDQLREAETLIEEIFSAYEDSLTEHERIEFKQSKLHAIAAMRWFAYWLEKNGDPYVPYTLGRENYEYRLKYFHLLEIDADSLLAIGKNILESTSKMIDSLERFLPEPQSRKVLLPPDFGKDDVLAYRQQEIVSMRDFVAASNMVTIPDWVGDLQVVETPGYLHTIIPGIAMLPPGALDGAKTSYFYVPPLPAKFDLGQAQYYYNHVHNRDFRSWVVHEGYPGHHLQLSIANNHSSLIRKTFFDYFFTEGWALYCEELMAQSGLYEDSLAAILRVLYGVRFRAVRVIVDVMLQTRQYTDEDAVNFMNTTLRRDSLYYAQEVKRYIISPGQPSSYLVGKLQIVDLLHEYKKAKGDNFNLKEFHDNLLSHGTIPINLVRKKMLSEID
jgi:hypothetical protein